MTETAEFDDFVRARSTHLLRLAYLLTRDHGNAEDLLQTALARSWSVWRRIDGDPEPYVRRVMVNAYSSWRGRRWHGERPSNALPEAPQPDAHAAVDARDEVGRALARLPRQQRAVLVLRYFEDMSEAQISEVLGISSGTVKSYASRGLAALRTDPSLVVLEPAAGDVPAGLERLAGVHERIRRDRRRRIGAVVVAGLVVLALLLGYVLSPLVRTNSLPTVGPQVGDYTNGYRLIAVLHGAAADRTASMLWTPPVSDIAVFPLCRTPRSIDHVWVRVYLDGVRRGGISCGPFDGYPGMSVAHMIAGQVVHVTLRLELVNGGSEADLPDRGTISVAFGEPVPFEQYHFPPRPDHLAPLTRPSFPDWLVLDARHPTGTLPAGGTTYDIEGGSQTPGFLTLSVPGRSKTLKLWDYDLTVGDCLDVLDLTGPLAVTATSQYTTGDWYMVIKLDHDETC